MPRRRNIRQTIIQRDGHCCAVCGADTSKPVETGFASRRKDGAEVDHKIALYLSDDDSAANQQVLCAEHHRQKTRADLARIAKVKRAAKKAERHRKRMDGKWK